VEIIVAADRVVAYGELRGLLRAFAWVNAKTNHGYTFEFDRLPAAATVSESVRLFLLEHHELEARVTLKRLRGWRTPVRKGLETWLFSFICDSHDGKLDDPHQYFSISERSVRRDMIGWVTDMLESAAGPTAAWRVEIEYGTRQFYECGWEDFAFESADGVYLLHLGVSD
jgi:hypothetical protein